MGNKKLRYGKKDGRAFPLYYHVGAAAAKKPPAPKAAPHVAGGADADASADAGTEGVVPGAWRASLSAKAARAVDDTRVLVLPFLLRLNPRRVVAQ